eukprot:jgi/Botrbrau1/1032/Bobra.0076s0005.1
MDLWAISERMGSLGSACIAAVKPHIDIGALHRSLAKQKAPGICTVSGEGLGALVHAQLGRPLDKRLQCSAWDSRPLTPEQLEYAALDAACLLMLLDGYIACAPPLSYPINEPTDAEIPAPSPPLPEDPSAPSCDPFIEATVAEETCAPSQSSPPPSHPSPEDLRVPRDAGLPPGNPGCARAANFTVESGFGSHRTRQSAARDAQREVGPASVDYGNGPQEYPVARETPAVVEDNIGGGGGTSRTPIRGLAVADVEARGPPQGCILMMESLSIVGNGQSFPGGAASGSAVGPSKEDAVASCNRASSLPDAFGGGGTPGGLGGRDGRGDLGESGEERWDRADAESARTSVGKSAGREDGGSGTRSDASSGSTNRRLGEREDPEGDTGDSREPVGAVEGPQTPDGTQQFENEAQLEGDEELLKEGRACLEEGVTGAVVSVSDEQATRLGQREQGNGSGTASQEKRESEKGSGLTRASQEEMKCAADVWACRLLVGAEGKPQRVRRGSRMSRSRMKALSGHKDLDASRGWPATIPWEMPGGPSGEPRFVCDVMVEGLARQLRLCGIDATVPPNLAKRQRFITYKHMVEAAQQEGRLILTTDKVFLRGGYSDAAYFVQGATKGEQLQEVLAAFNIPTGPGFPAHPLRPMQQRVHPEAF